MIAVGSSFLVSTVDRAVTPKPCSGSEKIQRAYIRLKRTRGISFMLNTTTP